MKEEIVDLICQAGVVGAGGAGFPTHVKVSSVAEVVILNGAECEPLLRVDQQLMVVEAVKVIRGLEAVMAATGAQTGIIALKAKYKDAYNALDVLIKGKPVRILTLADFFPAGDEHVLVYEVTGKVVPEGGIPLNVGCVVTNVETMLNVANALDGIPVTDTYVTVTGQVPSPLTLKLPIGAPVAEILALAGVKNTGALAVVNGGPMMGNILTNLSALVTKVSKGLIVLPVQHPLVQNKTLSMQSIIRRSKSACIQCRMCSDFCPRNLLGHQLHPHLIMRSLGYLQSEDDSAKMALLCCECGICELYACPMLLSPKQVNSALKKEMAKQGVKMNSSGEVQVSTERGYRKIPSKRLVARLGLSAYDVPAPLTQVNYSPCKVFIPVRQHIGAPGVPVVKAGQRVTRGALIAAIPEGALGANIHTSISGTVKNIGEWIEIEADGERGGES